MSNQVTIKLDSRMFYALIAIVAVLGIFGIGWWIGQLASQPGPQAAPAAAPGAQAPVAQNPAVQNPAQQPLDPNAAPQITVQPPSKGSPPLLVSEVQVGDNEPRLALPELEATNFTHDFGKIAPDQVAEKDFIVKNAGTAELVIQEATASCGCTAALVADSTVAPGEETTVRVSYDPRVNREAGRFVTKQVRIKSNDPVVPLAEFTITADVQAQ